MDLTVAQQLFLIFLISGLMLVGAEIFVPGGVLGTLGAIAILGAMIAAYAAFDNSMTATYVNLGIILLVGLALALWISIFPRTRLGRSLTVSHRLDQAKATQDGLSDLLHHDGEARSDLRPAGFAIIDGHRIDVITRGEMIDKGTQIRVIEVEGNRVVVKACPPADRAAAT